MKIGIICYASVGGSGIVATELGKALADRGHQVHIISADVPFRLGEYHPGLSFHPVHTPSYPLFREPQYVLSLANKVVHVARDFELLRFAARDRQGLPARTGPVLGEQDDLPDVLGVVGELALDRLEDGVRLAADRDDP